MQQPLVALDVGSTKVACAIGLPHDGVPGFELLGSSVVAYPAASEAWLGDPLMVSRTIEQALEATAVSVDFHRALVAIDPPALTSEQAQAAVTLGDEPMTVRSKDLDRLQRTVLDHTLGIDREPLVVERLGCTGNGFEMVRDPRGRSATRLTGLFHIVAMPMACRRAVVQAVESVGLEVASLTYTLPAALASTADEPLARQRVLMIDIGGLRTDIGLFVDGLLTASETIPWGGLKLAARIASELHVTIDQALTWSLEGVACRKREVRSLVTQHWELIQQAIGNVLKEQPRPDAVLLGGRGSLIDGFAEWVERTTQIPTTLCRSPRTSQMSDLARQVALSPAIGLLELSTRDARGASPRSPRVFNRLIDRTRTILTEYF